MWIHKIPAFCIMCEKFRLCNDRGFCRKCDKGFPKPISGRKR